VSPVGGNGALSRVRVRERPEVEKEASGGGGAAASSAGGCAGGGGRALS
jgi:hypothetical protein